MEYLSSKYSLVSFHDEQAKRTVIQNVLYDELCAFQGLDEKDLDNYFCAARYVTCLKKFNIQI